MKARVLLPLIIFIDIAFLLFSISDISISYHEAEIFFDQKNFIHFMKS